jgi:hypothetical protein
MVWGRHARGLATLGLQVADPDHSRGGLYEGCGYIWERTGRENTRVQRAGPEEDPVRFRDRFQRSRRHPGLLGTEPKKADLRVGRPDRRLAFDQGLASVGKQAHGLEARRQDAATYAELAAEPLAGLLEVAERFGERPDYKVAQWVLAEPVYRDGPRERAGERSLIGRQSHERTPEVTHGGSVPSATQRPRGATVVSYGHDDRQLITIIAQGTEYSSEAVTASQHRDASAHARATRRLPSWRDSAAGRR